MAEKVLNGQTKYLITMERIDLKTVDLKHQQITKVIDFYISIEDDYIEYVLNFYSDVPVDKEDESLGWVNERTKAKIIAFKSFISGFQVERSEFNNAFRVDILVTGFSTDVSVFFKTDAEANNFYEKLCKWKLTTKIYEQL